MSKKYHDGDCHIYSSVVNRCPEDGICTCGFGLEWLRTGGSQFRSGYFYSLEKIEQIEQQAPAPKAKAKKGKV